MSVDIRKQSEEFQIALLARLKQDCLYYLGYGCGYEKNLWSGNVEQQISDMKELYELLSENNELDFITAGEIDYFEEQMRSRKGLVKIGEQNGFSRSMDDIKLGLVWTPEMDEFRESTLEALLQAPTKVLCPEHTVEQPDLTPYRTDGSVVQYVLPEELGSMEVYAVIAKRVNPENEQDTRFNAFLSVFANDEGNLTWLKTEQVNSEKAYNNFLGSVVNGTYFTPDLIQKRMNELDSDRTTALVLEEIKDTVKDWTKTEEKDREIG